MPWTVCIAVPLFNVCVCKLYICPFCVSVCVCVYKFPSWFVCHSHVVFSLHYTKISFLFVCLGSCVCVHVTACIFHSLYFVVTHSCVFVCVCVCLGGHAVDQAPQLFDHSLYQLLFVSVILPELREDVVLLTGVLHFLQ